jgi:hypothetical protein
LIGIAYNKLYRNLKIIIFLIIGINLIGKYQCNKTGNYHYGDSTYYFDTTVIVTITKENDSFINILDATLKINTNGEFGGGLYSDSAYHGFGGYFINDSVFFNTYQGGLCCFTSLNYKGKKI